MTDVLRLEIFNRQTKEKVEESPFAVVHKQWCKNMSLTYTISLESHGVTRKSLLCFSVGRFSISQIIEDRIGLLLTDEPNMLFIIQFAPFENEAAVAFHTEIFYRRSLSLDPISEDELVGRVKLNA